MTRLSALRYLSTGCTSLVSLTLCSYIFFIFFLTSISFLNIQQVYGMLISSNNTALQPQFVFQADEKGVVSHDYVA